MWPLPRFSPVAGIQWVETPQYHIILAGNFPSFSPVAGIQWVETQYWLQINWEEESFSPVAGIQWVETP